ncbi:hypothetical protein G0Q06_03255 [Puniceicoccales bacterium CK1056]|uniref:Uncharacterized protein n=1 Tax=Oceanipulchritudo coccoides TaxID=2706888 RepID=A0A6B2LXU7_9BACT|nr:hypothetical protein [Oceanipulchritudo coccoides]NDV61461.1 hypothetical protein [Oceanipulchritudo coccoides]
MNTTTMESGQKVPFTAEEWDKLRFLFQDSVMAKTNLCKLAQNMGAKWPIRGKNETPGKYTGHTLDSLLEMTEFYGKENRLPLLYSILKETQSLDDPFSDMVNHLDKVAHMESDATSALKQMEVPLDFPVELANFTRETLSLCRSEGIHTISQFVEFAQKSAKSVIISGDYRLLLNALTQQDKKVLKVFLPIREDEPGLFLAEAIGHMARQLGDNKAASLLEAYQISTTRASWQNATPLAKQEVQGLIGELKLAVKKRMDLMPDEAQQLRHAVNSGEAARVRFFVSLRDPDIESLSIAIALAALDVKPKSKGLLGRFLN